MFSKSRTSWSLGLRTDRGAAGQSIRDIDDDFVGYLDTPEFKGYAAAIEMIIHAAPEIPATKTHTMQPGLITVRQIHEALGDQAYPRWTQDALDSLRSIEPVGVMITRYRKKIGVTPLFRKIPKNKTLQWIFNRHEHPDAPAIEAELVNP